MVIHLTRCHHNTQNLNTTLDTQKQLFTLYMQHGCMTDRAWHTSASALLAT